MDLTKLSAEELNEFAKQNLPPDFVNPDTKKIQKKICLGILAYDGKIHCRTMMCLFDAITRCAAEGWGFTIILRESDSMVARGRSFLASQFLENEDSKDCTDLVFIDTDLSWRGDEFVRICKPDVDILGGAYPFKDESGDFPLRWPADGLMAQDGLWMVQAVTPGFLRISRRVLERIARDMPWLEFRDRANANGQRSWMFFDNLQRPTGVYDEGYVFCERARSVGFQTYMDPTLNLTHIGLKAYNHGTIQGWLDRKSQTFEKLESEFPEVPPLLLMKKAMGEKVDLDAAREKVVSDKMAGVIGKVRHGESKPPELAHEIKQDRILADLAGPNGRTTSGEAA